MVEIDDVKEEIQKWQALAGGDFLPDSDLPDGADWSFRFDGSDKLEVTAFEDELVISMSGPTADGDMVLAHEVENRSLDILYHEVLADSRPQPALRFDSPDEVDMALYSDGGRLRSAVC